MFALLIALCSIGGGLAFGAMMVVGVMLHSGKWGDTPQKRLHEAKIATQLSELEEARAEHRFKTSQIEMNRQLMELQTDEKIAETRDRIFQKELTAGGKDASPSA